MPATLAAPARQPMLPLFGLHSKPVVSDRSLDHWPLAVRAGLQFVLITLRKFVLITSCSVGNFVFQTFFSFGILEERVRFVTGD